MFSYKNIHVLMFSYKNIHVLMFSYKNIHVLMFAYKNIHDVLMFSYMYRRYMYMLFACTSIFLFLYFYIMQESACVSFMSLPLVIRPSIRPQVRLQTQARPSLGQVVSEPLFRGTLDCAIKTVKLEVRVSNSVNL